MQITGLGKRARLRRRVHHVAQGVRQFGGRIESEAERCARELLANDGSLTSGDIAARLRVIAGWMEQVADAKTAELRALEAEYGEVFRTRTTFSGEYYTPYVRYLDASRKIAEARRLYREAVDLAAAHDRRTRKAWRWGRPDLATSYEQGDTARLRAELDNRDPHTRVLAARFLGRSQDRAAVDGLIGLLDDPESSEEAAKGLGAIGDPRAVEPLIGLLRKTRDVRVTGSAIVALGDIGDSRAVDYLISRLGGGFEANLAAGMLAKIGDPRAVEPLRAVLARLRDATPETDTSNRLRDLDCRVAQDAIHAIENR